MDEHFWQRMHGGSTHFPIVLLLASVVCDFFAWRSRDQVTRRALHLAGFGGAIGGVLGGVGAVISGLVMTRGEMMGSGFEKFHHLFVWPAFTLCSALVAWRVFRRGILPKRTLMIYLTGMSLASALMMGAGFWGGEMLLGVESDTGAKPASTSMAKPGPTALVARGHELFLLSCAHCHGSEGRGDGPDEGADLHDLHKSDARIANTIHEGVKGEMPRFGSKFGSADIQALTAFIRSLH